MTIFAGDSFYATFFLTPTLCPLNVKRTIRNSARINCVAKDTSEPHLDRTAQRRLRLKQGLVKGNGHKKFATWAKPDKMRNPIFREKSVPSFRCAYILPDTVLPQINGRDPVDAPLMFSCFEAIKFWRWLQDRDLTKLWRQSLSQLWFVLKDRHGVHVTVYTTQYCVLLRRK